ncbi:MAG: FUSC family protein [Solirubrobacteraceae bacterium]
MPGAVTPTAPRVRGSVARRVRRLRAESWNIGQSTLAAGAAWMAASLIHPRPFFAPVAAVISLGTARGGRTRRAVELSVGVAVGIGVADLIVTALGSSSLVLMLVVALAMSAALLLGAGVMLVNQAAVSAIIAVASVAPGATPSPYRVLDALIGGAFALLVGQVLFPRDPVRMMARAAAPVVSDLAKSLDLVADALREGDVEAARRALAVARATDDDLGAFFDAVALARETFFVRRPGRRTRERLPLYAEAAQQMDYAVRNTRVLARRAISAVRRHGQAPAQLADAVSLLGQAVLELGTQLDDPERDVATRRLALEAAVKATSVLESDPGLSHAVIIGQIRSTAVDLLRGSGLSSEESAAALEAAARRAGAAT